MVQISKNYVPKESEKYMCEKHKLFFKNKLSEWKKDLIRSNNEALYIAQWMTIARQQIS